MLLLVLTSYLFVQCPRLWAWRTFFLSPKAIARFRVFQKKVMKKVITHNSNTVNVLSSFFRCSRLSLTTSCRFQAPHVIMLRY